MWGRNPIIRLIAFIICVATMNIIGLFVWALVVDPLMGNRMWTR